MNALLQWGSEAHRPHSSEKFSLDSIEFLLSSSDEIHTAEAIVVVIFSICILMRSSNQENKVQIIRFKWSLEDWWWAFQFEGRTESRMVSKSHLELFRFVSFKALLM